jgi:hypothetical protein
MDSYMEDIKSVILKLQTEVEGAINITCSSCTNMYNKELWHMLVDEKFSVNKINVKPHPRIYNVIVLMTCLSCKPEFMEVCQDRDDEKCEYKCILGEMVKRMTDNYTKPDWPYVRAYGILPSEPNKAVPLNTYDHPALAKEEWNFAMRELAKEDGIEHLLA